MKVFVLDSYDSFTYNLVHYMEGWGAEVVVQRNDEVSFDVIDSCDKLVLSPGPGLPSEAGELMNVIRRFAGVKPILGICLGHQAIAEYYGYSLKNLNEVYHGVEQQVHHDSTHYLFQDVPKNFSAGLYYSWTVEDIEGGVLNCVARNSAGLVMALAHPYQDVCSVQFHPESIMTPEGRKLLSNWLGA